MTKFKRKRNHMTALKICKGRCWNKGKRKKGRKNWSLAQPNIFWPHVPPSNGGDTVRIKTPSWKLIFDHQMTPYTLFKDHEHSHSCPCDMHAKPSF
jgi:hypothetical protein